MSTTVTQFPPPAALAGKSTAPPSAVQVAVRAAEAVVVEAAPQAAAKVSPGQVTPASSGVAAAPGGGSGRTANEDRGQGGTPAIGLQGGGVNFTV